tara:strand:+ start:6836 stop:7384 length:549 start_codon:yes stop_codon:yes gene_type:complete
MDTECSDKINLDELSKHRNDCNDNKEKIYRNILNRVHNKIKLTARQRNNDTFTFYLVPDFLLGVPIYNTSLCIAYIINKLESNGFFVKYTHPHLLFISWKHHIDKRKRVEIKKMYGISIDGQGNVVKNNETKTDINTMLLKDDLINVKDNKKIFRSTSEYKPIGNLIYSENLIKKSEERTKT